MNRLIKSMALAATVGLSACVTTHQTPKELSVDCGTPDDCWAQVLKRHVNAKGQVNFDAVAQDKSALETYVRYIASESPKSNPEKFPSSDDKMAYYLNSYNALAMWGVIENGIPKDFDSFFKRLSFFMFNEFQIGGSYTSLYDYENDVIRSVGDPRVHFALNCMSVGCPRLPQQPFPVKNLNDTLEAAAFEFFRSPLYLQVDDKEKIVSISEILKFFTNDFVGEGKSPNLIAYVNKYSAKKIPENYEVKFIPYNWTINRQ
jgi:hypothetical protein